MLKMLIDWLADRERFVDVKGIHSEKQTITSNCHKIVFEDKRRPFISICRLRKRVDGITLGMQIQSIRGMPSTDQTRCEC